MRPPARLEMPHVALLFVIDKSGSMGAGSEGNTKLDLAKAAAIAAADIMNPTDQVGILAFDAGWDWALPFRQVGKGEWISEKLSSLQSDGGTDLYKAMLEAHRVIAGKQAAIKHAIVLSDGLTDKADFQTLVQRWRATASRFRRCRSATTPTCSSWRISQRPAKGGATSPSIRKRSRKSLPPKPCSFRAIC